MFNFGKKEKRSLENPQVPISSQALFEFLGLDSGSEGVTIEAALGVPAIWCAVNFIADTMAALPLNVYNKTKTGREKSKEPIQSILHDAPNDIQSSFHWRKSLYVQYLTKGRGLALIERDALGKVKNLILLDPANTEIIIKTLRKYYIYDGKTYDASEVIDISFMEKPDMSGQCYSPILRNKETVALMIAVTKYGASFFRSGGIPAHVYKTNAKTPEAYKNARSDLREGFKQAYKDGTNTILVHTTEDLKALNNDPEKMQMIETQRFCIEQASRMFMIPPAFLHDLTHGTFANTEQQGTQLVKYKIGNLANQFEQELNLKLFGRFNKKQYAEFNLDGLLRGDFATRMAGYAQGIQNAIFKPSQVHAMENLPSEPQADVYLIQGATVPLGAQPVQGVTNG